jgi:deazaflavin-dependent oxidoreductase (nitroreductase family)
MADMNDFNAQIIDEFRQNGGKLGGGFAGAPMLLLTTTGAKSGKERTAPLAYLRDGDRAVIFGSKAGADTHPDWFHNLRANPRVRVELGTETFDADAVITDGAERDRLFELQKQVMPPFAEYEAKTDRVIPVIVLERVE